jgi:hypothetical protein
VDQTLLFFFAVVGGEMRYPATILRIDSRLEWLSLGLGHGYAIAKSMVSHMVGIPTTKAEIELTTTAAVLL